MTWPATVAIYDHALDEVASSLVRVNSEAEYMAVIDALPPGSATQFLTDSVD